MPNALVVLWRRLSANRFVELLLATASAWRELRVSRLAAALSFYAMLSLVPLLISVHGLFSLVIDHKVLASGIDNQITAFLGADQAKALRGMIDRAQGFSFASLQTIIGSLLTFVTAAGVFIELKDSMDGIWKTPKQQRAGIFTWVRSYFAPLSMVVGFGFLLLVSLVLDALLSLGMSGLSRWQPALAATAAVGNALIGWVVAAALFAAIFRFLPTRKVAWRDVWLGAALTATLFIIGRVGISIYVGHSDFSGKYGAAGSFIAIIVWIYYSSQILFTGAVFTREHARVNGTYSEEPAATPPAT